MGATVATLLPSRDFDFKYKATGRWDQLDCALVGTCIMPSKLSGSAKARSNGSNNLSGVVSDGNNMYAYCRDNGATISLFSFQIPQPAASDMRNSIKAFLQNGSNNKLLYISGHGDSDGDIPLGDGDYIQVHHVLEWLAEVRFAGHITIVVDACYSGMWVKRIKKYIDQPSRERVDEIYHPLANAAQACGAKTFINVRASSLSNETSRDSSTGGRYTNAVLNGLRKECHWTSQDGRGWGTKVLTERAPDSNSVVFSTSKTEVQTDLSCDFVIKPDRSTVSHYPSDRAEYV